MVAKRTKIGPLALLGAVVCAGLALVPTAAGQATGLHSSTYFAGAAVYDVAVDSQGATYLTGIGGGSGFQTTPGAYDEVGERFGGDAFVAKLSPDGRTLEYSTLLSGSGHDQGTGIAVDRHGNAYVTGDTGSHNFPTTENSFDREKDLESRDAFVAKLSADGSTLLYGAYLGGTPHREYDGIVGSDYGEDIAVDENGAAYLTGVTQAVDFPTTHGAFDRTLDSNIGQDVFVTKVAPDGSSLGYSTYLPGSSHDWGFGIAVDHAGYAYVTGHTTSGDFATTQDAYDTSHNLGADVFVTRLAPDGSHPSYSTYIGGGGSEGGADIALDDRGSAYVTGGTLFHESWGTNPYPTTAGAYDSAPDISGNEFDGDMFVTKLSADGSALAYSTALGGEAEDRGDGIAVDPQGRAVVTGVTAGPDFPVTANAFDSTHNGGFDLIVARLNRDGSQLPYSTFLGGAANDGQDIDDHGVAVDPAGKAHVGARSYSHDYPTTSGALQPSFTGPTSAGVVSRLALPRTAPASLRLDPQTADLAVGGELCLTAVVMDVFGDAVPGVDVAVAVQGANDVDRTVVTGADGYAQLCYRGELHGTDTIHAAAGEPAADAVATWRLPTPGKECKADGAGRITTAAGDSAQFAGNARFRAGESRGNPRYWSHGPAQPLFARSVAVDVVLCEHGHATVFGEGVVGRSTPVSYRIELVDRGPHGRDDAYRVLLSNGYDSGLQALDTGNVRIR